MSRESPAQASELLLELAIHQKALDTLYVDSDDDVSSVHVNCIRSNCKQPIKKERTLMVFAMSFT